MEENKKLVIFFPDQKNITMKKNRMFSIKNNLNSSNNINTNKHTI